MTDNPFFETWNTPFELPPFDRIRPEHFPPAFDRGMAEHATDIAAIAGSSEAPDFRNTVEALERSGQLLRRVGRVFNNLTSSATNEALDAIDRDYAPKLAAHRIKIMLDPGLFARVDALWRERDRLNLAPDQYRLLERHHLNFVRSGALLNPAQKARMAEISERLASLHTLFSQNMLHDEDEWRLVLTEGDLDGLPDFARAAAARAKSGNPSRSLSSSTRRHSSSSCRTFWPNSVCSVARRSVVAAMRDFCAGSSSAPARTKRR